MILTTICRAIMGSSKAETLRELLCVAFEAFKACGSFSEDSEAYAYLPNLAGVFDANAGKFEQALQYYLPALEIRQKVDPIDYRHL